MELLTLSSNSTSSSSSSRNIADWQVTSCARVTPNTSVISKGFTVIQGQCVPWFPGLDLWCGSFVTTKKAAMSSSRWMFPAFKSQWTIFRLQCSSRYSRTCAVGTNKYLQSLKGHCYHCKSSPIKTGTSNKYLSFPPQWPIVPYQTIINNGY